MSRRFCAECGDIGISLHENFCQKCYWKFNRIIDIKERRLEIPYCLTCFAVKLPTGWSNANDQYSMPKIIGYGYMRNIIAELEVDRQLGDHTKINWLNPNPEFFISYIGISDIIDGFEPHQETIDVEIKLIGGICKTCVRRKTGTHDVTVQIRAKDRSLSKKEVDRATTIVFTVANELYHESTDAYISDIIENHGGYDFYLGSNTLAEEFVSALRKEWIGHHEKNYKLITEEKDNKRVYRVTHLYRLPSVSGGETILYLDKLFLVKRVTANSIKLIQFKDHKTISIHDWDKISFPNPEPIKIIRLVVSEDKLTSSYLLMNLTSYETEDINKDEFPKPLEIGSEIELIYYQNRYYLPLN